ncbi:MAG: NAD(P)-dependent oxidoreductase [Aquabacterium sp.]
MPAILLTFNPAARALYYGDTALAALGELGELRLHEQDEALSGDALIAAAAGCQAMVIDRQTAAPAALFASSPELAVVLRCAMDIRNIDVAAASAAGVLVTRASAGFGTAVAEWVLGVMVDLSRGISRSVRAYHRGEQPPVRMGRELRGAQLGIIGYGHIGRRVGALALALGMHVSCSDPNVQTDEPGVRRMSLDELLSSADFVLCLATATPQTENLMAAAQFARMKPAAFFINASRGNLVDEAALLAALDSGRLAGCALDVGRAPDQMPSSALARHPLVIATPHIGGLTPAATEHQALETVSQLTGLMCGDVPAGAVNAGHARRLATLRAVALRPGQTR